MASTDSLFSGSYDVSNRNKSIYSDDYDAYVNRHAEEEKLKQLYEDKGTLSFTDMLQLMVAQFQNQTMDDQASTTDMMNQLVSMSTMQAMNQMVDHMGELRLANVMSYAASLVEKEVTVFDGWDKDGKMIERTDYVTGMGTYGGQTVIFLGKKGDMYYLSDILAVGKLPPPEEIETPEDKIEHAEDCPDPDNCKGECLDSTDGSEEPKLPEDTDVKVPDNLDSGYTVDDKDPEYNGENGTDEIN